jgi:hypothetical protein
VAVGGKNEILNLATSYVSCNQGKGVRELSDDSIVERQRRQIEELQERREQLEMMLEWRNSLADLEDKTINHISDFIGRFSDFVPNDKGRSDIKRWLRRFSFDEIIAAVNEAFAIYYIPYDHEGLKGEAWNKAFSKIPAIAAIKRQELTKPYMRELFYIKGIARRRFRMKRYDVVHLLEEAHLAGATLESLSDFTKGADDFEEYENELLRFIKEKSTKS